MEQFLYAAARALLSSWSETVHSDSEEAKKHRIKKVQRARETVGMIWKRVRSVHPVVPPHAADIMRNPSSLLASLAQIRQDRHGIKRPP